jgi:PIN domain nuclease of toxin-antitoxin system
MSLTARDAITRAEDVYVSAASAWETRTKYRLGKLSGAAAVATDLPDVVARLKFRPLPIEFEDGDLAGALEGRHGDPFDRMLVAQALRRGLALVSNDAALDAFGVTRVW